MVQPVQLFELAANQARWLAARQAAVAGNIANVNTTGYGAVDVAPFEEVLANKTAQLATTSPKHFAIAAGANGFGLREERVSISTPSENTVQLENELMKAGEVRRSLELNTAIVKAFHRMMTMTTRP